MPTRTKPRKTELRFIIGTGYHVSKPNAERLFTVIRDVFHGSKPTPKELIAEAKKKRSPIHDLFEWDTQKAAKRQWYDTAQYLLRAIHLVVVDVETEEIIKKPVRAFVPVKVDGCHRIPPENYVPVQRLAERPKDRAAVLNRARADFRSWLARYERYADFVEVFDPVIRAFEQLEKRLQRTEVRKKAG